MVVKVGGSLFNLPDLSERLQRLLQGAGSAVVLVPGGGAVANVVREWAHIYHLGDDRAHWLALRALSMNARLLASLLPQARVIRHLGDRHELFEAKRVPIVDMYHFARTDERQADHLPHSWQVTSDSLAARLAERLAAEQLMLLKSVTIPPDMGWPEAARRGFVDEFFPEMARRSQFRIRALNFRQDV